MAEESPDGTWVGPVVVAAIAMAATIGMGRFGISLLLTGMRDTLDFSTTAAGVLAGGSLLGFLVGSVSFASRTAAIGATRLLAMGAIVAAAGFALTAVAPAYLVVLPALVIGGVGTGIATVAGTALALATAPTGRRGLALGVVNGGTGAGVIAIGALAPRFDGPGGWRTIWWIVAGVSLFAAALAATMRTAPVAPAGPAVWRVGDAWGLCLVYAGFGFAFASYSTYFGSFLVDQQELSSSLAGGAWRVLGIISLVSGGAWRVLGIISLVSGVAWGRLSDRWGRAMALGALMLVQAMGFAALLPGSPTAAYASAAVVGATAFAVPGMVAAAAADLVGPARASALYGFSIIFSSVGQASGPPLVGSLSDAMGSYRPAFVVAALVAAATAATAATSAAVLRTGVKVA